MNKITYSFGQTVFGGSLDLKTGILTVTDVEIASYNGEALPSTWMSDRDVYSPNTTPTIGAQVVYKLATPTQIQLTTSEIHTILGDNAVWADTDSTIELSYMGDSAQSYVPINRTINNKSLTSNITLTPADLVPISSKTYTDVIGTANTWEGATFFFGSIIPERWTDLWYIKYRILTYVPGKDGYDQVADVVISGSYNALRSYYSWNCVGAYYPAYYHVLYRLKEAGFNNGYGHSLGVRFQSAYSPTDVNYMRTIVVDIYETNNCKFEFYDDCLPYASIPGSGSTNYDNYSELNYCSNGLQETGDANDVNYQNRIYYTSRQAVAALYRYQICLTTLDNKILPVNSVNNNTATGKTLTTESFDPFGGIYFYNTTTNVNANANIGNATLYRQVLADMRYSFNVGAGSYFTARLPVYIKATPQSDGSAKLDATTPLVQALPTTEDGSIYIYLGQAYEDTNPYRIELMLEHPVYYYHNGAIRQWTNGFSESYDDLTDKPTIPVAIADLQEDTTHRVVTDAQIASWNAKSDFSGSYNDLSNKPTIATSLAQLSDDSGHRTVTDAEKTAWNGKYVKSSTGIPMNDLSDEVQTLLRASSSETAVFTDEIVIGDVRFKRYTTKRLMITDVES